MRNYCFFLVSWHPFLFTFGSVLLTIGIILPAAVYFQSLSNEQAFKILNSCNIAGIETIFVSRKQDDFDLRHALDLSMAKTKEISLLGVAFRTFFDPSAVSSEIRSKALNSISTKIRVLILDPESEAAIRRSNIEFGNATCADIEYTINNGLSSLAAERLIKLKSDASTEIDMRNIDNDILKKLNFEVRIYSLEPVVFIMQFDDAIYTEQYHSGRPKDVPMGSCIGKSMPVLKYRHGSIGFKNLDSHFEQTWKEAKDITPNILEAASKKLALRS